MTGWRSTAVINGMPRALSAAEGDFWVVDSLLHTHTHTNTTYTLEAGRVY